MEEISIIYSNSFGMSFHWDETSKKDVNKIQIIFRDTGMFLSTAEIKDFSKLIKHAFIRTKKCGSCSLNNSCKSILLETPSEQISFALNYKELKSIDDLIKGTLFNLAFSKILNKHMIKKSPEL